LLYNDIYNAGLEIDLLIHLITSYEKGVTN